MIKKAFTQSLYLCTQTNALPLSEKKVEAPTKQSDPYQQPRETPNRSTQPRSMETPNPSTQLTDMETPNLSTELTNVETPNLSTQLTNMETPNLSTQPTSMGTPNLSAQPTKLSDHQPLSHHGVIPRNLHVCLASSWGDSLPDLNATSTLLVPLQSPSSNWRISNEPKLGSYNVNTKLSEQPSSKLSEQPRGTSWEA